LTKRFEDTHILSQREDSIKSETPTTMGPSIGEPSPKGAEKETEWELTVVFSENSK